MTDNNYRGTNISTGSIFGNGIGTSGGRRGTSDTTSFPPNDAARGYGSEVPHRERTTPVRGDDIDLHSDPQQGPPPDIGGGQHIAQDRTTLPDTGSNYPNAVNASDEQPTAQRAPASINAENRTADQNPHRRKRHKRPPNGKKGKGALKIASLNMKGGGSTQTESKWELINQLMRDDRIDILALQETHMTDELRDRMNTRYEKRMHIISSAMPLTPNAAGIAIVLNKGTTPWKDVTSKVIVEGRAIQIRVSWCSEFSLQVLAVYAPNATGENAAFWATLKTKLTEENIRPNCILGDFNLVEDSVDRSPAHEDSQTQTQSLTDLKSHLKLADGWRRENPTKIDFSFRMDGRSIFSRIDRIYVREDLLPFTNGWDIRRTGIRTDHSLVTMEIMNPWLPHQGSGRYAMPVFVLDQKELMAKIQRIGLSHMDHLTRISTNRTETCNPQTAHRSLKTEIIKCIREYTKALTPRINKQIDNIKDDKEAVLNDAVKTDEEKRTEASLLDEKIRELEMIKFGRTRDNVASQFFLEGETMGKTWIRASKDVKARDVVAAQRDIRIPGRRIVRHSTEMAEIMKHHHETVQTDGAPEENEEYKTHVDQVLSNIEKTLSEEQIEDLGTILQEEDIKEALNSMPDGKAAGLDGIVNELWKKLSRTYDDNRRHGPPKFDVVKALTATFQDIQKYGVCEQTAFAEGWMCPLYKKGDRTEPSNYRPITVLNTDYKVYTKALSIKLTKVAPSLIHKDQAGFMVGRRIEDQTELARLVIDWAEMTETNGMIVCLDQEKAYDKVIHAFLWATMRKMKFPESFIKSIQAVYTGATTVVMLNGEMSSPFLVIRGVRQGDPLSCLLFNLAIESLAQMLRNSNLAGLRVNEKLERIITTLFADDTTVYLSENDSFQDLEGTLKRWCKASGGRFNVPKTVITPIGTEAFRTTISDARTACIPLAPIPEEIHIARDGEATRLLGAFIGNGVDNPSVWTPTKERITNELARWSRLNPTINGRRLIANMVVGGLTQYKTCVQGMSKDTEEAITTQMRRFMWNSDSPPAINTQTLTRPIEEGGKKLLDIKARNEAIDLMRLKRYLKSGEERPAWAQVADKILRGVVTKDSRVTDRKAYSNPFLQNIKINSRAGEKRLPASLKRMVVAARKHSVKFAPLLLSEDLMKEMPIWFHPGLADRKRIQYNATWAKCLRTIHGVETVGEMLTFCETFGPDHLPSQDCDCARCEAYVADGCSNPEKCRSKGVSLVTMLGNRWDPRREARMRTLSEIDRDRANPEERVFDPDFTVRSSLSDGFRVFTNEESSQIPTNVIYPTEPPDRRREDETIVYTDGSALQNGSMTARAGAGIWFGPNNDRNKALRVPETWEQTNNAGEAMAVAIAGKEAESQTDLVIATDSKITMDGLTLHLRKWEDQGWIGVSNKEVLRYAAGILRCRDGTTTFRKVKGHSNLLGNDAADALANAGALKEAQGEAPQMMREGFQNKGALLNGMSQALLYKGIKSSEKVKERRYTEINLDKTRWAVEASGGGLPTNSRIWRSIECKSLTKEARAFIWRTMHGGYKLGEYWENITGYENRAECPRCRIQESMEHILLECEASGQATVWRLVEHLYEARGVSWKRPTLGDILGCQMITPGTTTGDNGGASRRFNAITISESARVIWKARCHWRIEKESDPEHMPQEEHIVRKWRAAMMRRVKMDCLTTSESKKSKKATPVKKVTATWAHLISEGQKVQRAWEDIGRVLVGIG